MNVVWHDDPCLHSVFLAVRLEENLFDKLGHLAMSKPAFAATAIEPGFELLAFCGIIRLARNHFPFHAARHGKGALQLKRDELRHTRRIEVWQVPALMPPAKAFSQF